jgi:hypothetical protein
MNAPTAAPEIAFFFKKKSTGGCYTKNSVIAN